MIILLGFPKSGTVSFNKLFNDLGYKSYHWKYKDNFIADLIKKNDRENKNLLSFIDEKEYDKTALTQIEVCMNKAKFYWPQITNFKKIYRENRKAIFILNKRDPNKLIKSLKKWKNWNDMSLFDRIINWGKDSILESIYEEINNNINNDEIIRKLILNHYSKVENFFKTRKNNPKFIIYDIENDNLKKLSIYINLKDFKNLPHENITKLIK